MKNLRRYVVMFLEQILFDPAREKFAIGSSDGTVLSIGEMKLSRKTNERIDTFNMLMEQLQLPVIAKVTGESDDGKYLMVELEQELALNNHFISIKSADNYRKYEQIPIEKTYTTTTSYDTNFIPANMKLFYYVSESPNSYGFIMTMSFNGKYVAYFTVNKEGEVVEGIPTSLTMCKKYVAIFNRIWNQFVVIMNHKRQVLVTTLADQLLKDGVFDKYGDEVIVRMVRNWNSAETEYGVIAKYID